MKRSKTLEAIQSYLSECDLSDVDENADYHARMILRILEDEKLIDPPDYYIKHDEKGNYISHMHLWKLVKNTWEPENEDSTQN